MHGAPYARFQQQNEKSTNIAQSEWDSSPQCNWRRKSIHARALVSGQAQQIFFLGAAAGSAAGTAAAAGAGASLLPPNGQKPMAQKECCGWSSKQDVTVQAGPRQRAIVSNAERQAASCKQRAFGLCGACIRVVIPEPSERRFVAVSRAAYR